MASTRTSGSGYGSLYMPFINKTNLIHFRTPISCILGEQKKHRTAIWVRHVSKKV